MNYCGSECGEGCSTNVRDDGFGKGSIDKKVTFAKAGNIFIFFHVIVSSAALLQLRG